MHRAALTDVGEPHSHGCPHLAPALLCSTPPPHRILLCPPPKQAGIPTALSSDNVRDQFYAYGDLDMLEVFTQVGGKRGAGGGECEWECVQVQCRVCAGVGQA